MRSLGAPFGGPRVPTYSTVSYVGVLPYLEPSLTAELCPVLGKLVWIVKTWAPRELWPGGLPVAILVTSALLPALQGGGEAFGPPSDVLSLSPTPVGFRAMNFISSPK